jgi:maltose O-acetyltransferase
VTSTFRSDKSGASDSPLISNMTLMTDPGDGRSNRERMLAGDPYIAEDPDNHRRHLNALKLTADFINRHPHDEAAALGILKELLGSIGTDAIIKPPLYVDYGSHLFIGNGTFVNTGLVALDAASISIGADRQFGPNVQLLMIDPVARREKWERCKPIRIGDNVWIGGGVIVLAGITIGDNSIIGAGAVVTRDIPANVLAVGNPARVVREI